MSISQLQQDFVNSLKGVYEKDEAENIFYLTIESLTGINYKNNKIAKFTPDGCFIKMLGQIQLRLQQNEPIQYILNEAWFYEIPFYVDENVLIPRPETEELVDWIIKEHEQKEPITILEIGTGSGCIPIILKRKLPAATVYSCDISAKAIAIAAKNAHKQNIVVHFIELDFLEESCWPQLPKADIIVSNPPYIPQSDKISIHKNVLMYEPHTALFVSDSNPIVFYEAIAKAGNFLLKPNGSIYVEINEKFEKETIGVFKKNNFKTKLKTDMQGKERMIKAEK